MSRPGGWSPSSRRRRRAFLRGLSVCGRPSLAGCPRGRRPAHTPSSHGDTSRIRSGPTLTVSFEHNRLLKDLIPNMATCEVLGVGIPTSEGGVSRFCPRHLLRQASSKAGFSSLRKGHLGPPRIHKSCFVNLTVCILGGNAAIGKARSPQIKPRSGPATLCPRLAANALTPGRADEPRRSHPVFLRSSEPPATPAVRPSSS